MGRMGEKEKVEGNQIMEKFVWHMMKFGLYLLGNEEP